MKKFLSVLLTFAIILGMAANFSFISSAASSSYYFDSENGNDSYLSNSSSKPWKTLSKLNSKNFSSGSTVYIKRGSVYRGQLQTKAGVKYTAYGDGNAPLFLGSADAHQDIWQQSGYTNVWVYNSSFSEDVGNIIFNDAQQWGYKQVSGVNGFTGSLSELDSDLEFFHNTDGKVYLYSKTNPYTRFNSIEFALNKHIIVLKSNVTLDGLCLKYGGGHGAHGEGVNGVTIQNCEFGWIGGSILSGNTRYGNAIEFWDNCGNITIQNNRIYQMYDTGITAQCSFACNFSDFTISGNTIDFCSFSFEYYVPDGGSFNNISFTGNTCNYAGYGWGDQRSDSEYVSHVNSWFLYPNTSTNFTISNNTFNGSTENLFITGSSTQNTVKLSGNKYNQCSLGDDNWANPQLMTWYNGHKYQFKTNETTKLMKTVDSTAQFNYCPLPYDTAKITALKEAVFGVAEPTEENLAHLYQGKSYTTLYELMGMDENLGIIDFYNAIKEKRSANWSYAAEFISQNESSIKAAAASAITVTAIDKDKTYVLKYAQGDKYDNSVTKLPANSVPGSTVANWSVSGGETVDGKSTVLTSPHTITANRKGNSYNVSFDSNGGQLSSTEAKAVTYGAEYPTLPEGSSEKGVIGSWQVKTNPTASAKIISDAGYGRVGDIGVPAYFDITARNCDYVSKESVHYAPKPQYTPIMVMDNTDAPEIYLVASKNVYSNLSELLFDFYIDGSRLNYHNLQVTHCITNDTRFSLSGCGDFIEGTGVTAMDSTLNPVSYKLYGDIPEESCSFFVSIGVTSYHPTWTDTANEYGVKSFTAFVKFKINLIIVDDVKDGDTVQAFSNHTLIANWVTGNDIRFDNEFDFDAYNWDGVWSAEREVDYAANSYTLKNISGDAQNNTYNNDYCGGTVRGVMQLIPNHKYRISYNYKNNSAINDVKGNIRLFGFSSEACTGSMWTISPVDNSNPTWTASANESGSYSYEIIAPQDHYFVTLRCNAFNANGASVTFSDIYICDITNNLPHPQQKSKSVSSGKVAGALPTLSAQNYNFVGWYTSRGQDGNGTGKQLTESTVINSNINAFAKWELINKSVFVDFNGGTCENIFYNYAKSGEISLTRTSTGSVSGNTVLKAAYGSDCNLIAPVRKGYSFAGWFCGNKVLPMNEDGITILPVNSDMAVKALWNVATDTLLYGLNPGVTLSEVAAKNIDNTCYIAEYPETLGTNSLIVVKDKITDLVVCNYRLVIFGDVNGDGWYDGTDAVIVNCIAGGMLSEAQVGEAVYAAADCNHDGIIDSSDSELLQKAGVMLGSIDQTKSSDELIQTSSVYGEYLNLIEQIPDNAEAQESSFDSIINIFKLIFERLKNLFLLIHSIIML